MANPKNGKIYMNIDYILAMQEVSKRMIEIIAGRP